MFIYMATNSIYVSFKYLQYILRIHFLSIKLHMSEAIRRIDVYVKLCSVERSKPFKIIKGTSLIQHCYLSYFTYP
jgi:hypothetical protein